MDKGPPPPGGDQSQATKLITVWAVLTSLSVAIVTLRFVARAAASKHFGWDDWTMLTALVRSLLTQNATGFPDNLLRVTTVSHCSKIRSRRFPDAYWLWEAHLLLRQRTGHSDWQIEFRLRALHQSDYLFGEAIRGNVSTENWRFANEPQGRTFCHHRPLGQLHSCDCHHTIRTV